MTNYITDEVKALIGLESEWVEACDPVERGQIRRHAQAIMDPDPAYWNDEYAKSTAVGGVAAPPLFPLHALRVPADAPDSFERAATDPTEAIIQTPDPTAHERTQHCLGLLIKRLP